MTSRKKTSVFMHNELKQYGLRGFSVGVGFMEYTVAMASDGMIYIYTYRVFHDFRA
jgi:hypothetical protein